MTLEENILVLQWSLLWLTIKKNTTKAEVDKLE